MPAFKAGGPIQSIANLVRNLHFNYEFYILTSDKDAGDKVPMKDIIADKWIDFENNHAKVIYLSNKKMNTKNILKIINEIRPHKIFINGIYSFYFTLVPAFFFSDISIIHTRGMLHPGALTQKSIKKKWYVRFIKLFNIFGTATFCVSDHKELLFVGNVFKGKNQIKIAQNYPSSLDALDPIAKDVGKLKLISVALISPMKNHLIVLEAIKTLMYEVEWMIYGPIKDKNYWEICLDKIKELPSNIKVVYKGEIEPNRVADALNDAHFFILPSLSENFGHALFESMVSGKPIITSFNTPWNNLQENNAGYNTLLNVEDLKACIDSACMLNQEEYNFKVNKVKLYAKTMINLKVIENQYFDLFE